MVVNTLLSILAAFFLVVFICPWFVKYFKMIGLVVKDMNKKNTPLIPLSGGIVVLFGITFGIFIFIFLSTFLSVTNGDSFLSYRNVSILFASLCSIILVTLIGFFDDIVILGDKETSSGLKQWQKPILTLFAAIPLMVVNAGTTTMNLPFVGAINFGIFYALVLIPIGFVGASNMVNMFAGFNGLESGMGIVYTGMLGIYAYVNQSYLASLIAFVTCAALLGFIYYHWCPAKILAGDSLTYLLGAVLAVIAIVGNIEKAALIVAVPFFVEFLLKLRGRFKVKSYGYYKNGKIKSYYAQVYSIPHILTRTGRFTEKQIAWFGIIIAFVFSSLIWII